MFIFSARKASWRRLVALIVYFLLAGCATQPEVWKASSIAQLPSAIIRLVSNDQKVVGYVDRETVQKLLEIKSRIEIVAGVPNAELMIATGDEPNAFAVLSAQGPIVGINLSMIRLLGSDWDAYAAIIGHEYAHLSLNHSGVRQEREQARQGVSTMLGVILGVAGIPMGGELANVATIAVSTIYTRDEEREADRTGLNYAVRAGFDPQGAVRAWQRMMSVPGPSIPFLAAHPNSAERLDTMQQLIANMPKTITPPGSPPLTTFASVAKSTADEKLIPQNIQGAQNAPQEKKVPSNRPSGQNAPIASKPQLAESRYPDLMTAVLNSSQDDVNYFISRGANLNQLTGGSTYLIAAVINSDLEMVKLLVSNGADVNQVDNRGLTPLVYAKAIRQPNPELIRFLQNAGAINPFPTQK